MESGAKQTDEAAYFVGDAGNADAIGAYVPTGKTLHGAPVFENDRKCLLSREPHMSKGSGASSYGWILGQHQKPLYAIKSDKLEPPASGWRKFTGAPPLPSVARCSSAAEASLQVVRTWKQQGNLHFTLERYELAVEVWTRALSLLEGSSIRGSCHKTLSDRDGVVAALLTSRAEARLRQHRWEEALCDANEVLKEKPTHDRTLLRAAVAARELERYASALHFAQVCLDEHPNLQEAHALAKDLDKRLACQKETMPEATRAACKKLQGSLRRHERNKAGENTLNAFSGYGDACEKKATREIEPPPLTSLPYHQMGLPQEQTDLMDTFFQKMRDDKGARAKARATQQQQNQHGLAEQKLIQDVKQFEINQAVDESINSSLIHEAKFTTGDVEDVEFLLSGLELKQSTHNNTPLDTSVKQSVLRRQQLNDDLRKDRLEQNEYNGEVLAYIREMINVRRGEPSRFQQAGAEVYAWWTLPASVSGKDVQVEATQGGTHLTITVCGIDIFDRGLFLPIKVDDIVWLVDQGELHMTLTKKEKAKLWEQLGEVQEVRRDDQGEVIPDTLPEPQSSKDRIDLLHDMLNGDDGCTQNYDDLDVTQKHFVDLVRRIKHAKAIGDNDALSLAELELEEDFGRIVV